MHPFYKSHKFWVVVTGAVSLIASVVTGEATVPEVVNQFITLILGYCGIRVVESKVTK